MIGKNTVTTIRESVAPHPAPVLSLYLDVNPANPDAVRKAHVRKAKEALMELDLPNAYSEEVLRRIELDHVIPRGRTLVIFAGEDPNELFESYYFQTELPLLELGDRALAHWGAPYVAPILLALDEQERYALASVATESWRIFELFLGEIGEIDSGELEKDSAAWPHYTEARRSPGLTGPVRGGSSSDRYRDRKEVWTLRMYRRAANTLDHEVHERGIDRVILLGQSGPVSDFEAVLPRSLRQKVVARLPNPSNNDARLQEWLALVQPELEQIERNHEEELLDRVREQGIWGLEETLAALQEGRLSVLLVPWGHTGNVYMCEGSGLVAPGLEWAKRLCPGDSYQLVHFKEVLPELVDRYGVKLELLGDETAAKLDSEFGGLAGVSRW